MDGATYRSMAKYTLVMVTISNGANLLPPRGIW